MMINSEFYLTNIKCAACVAKIEAKLQDLPGISRAQVNLLTKSLSIEYSAKNLDAAVIANLAKIGFVASLQTPDLVVHKSMWGIFVPLVFGMFLMFICWYRADLFNFSTFTGLVSGVLSAFISLLIILCFGKSIIVSGWRGLITRNFSMHSLILIGVAAAWIYSTLNVVAGYIIANSGFSAKIMLLHEVYFEAALIIIGLINLGAYLEERAKDKTTQALQQLRNLLPAMANVIVAGNEQKKSTQLLVVGDLVKIRPGEQLAADGVIVEGDGYINESMLTGESMAVHKVVTDEVVGGSINSTGSFIFRVSKTGANTLLGNILNLVKSAQLTKPQLAKIADRITRIFVPLIIILAIVSALVWFILVYLDPSIVNQYGLDSTEHNIVLAQAIYYSLSVFMSVLLIACPCSIGLAIPVSLMVGVGKGAKQGVLLRNPAALSDIDKVKSVFLDKTGTLTEAKARIVNLELGGNYDKTEVMSFLYALEINSEHPLANAIIESAAQYPITPLILSEFKSFSGLGVSGVIDGKLYQVGSAQWLSKLDVTHDLLIVKNDFSQVYLVEDGNIIARVDIADTLRFDAANLVQQLKKLDYQVIMLSGDNLGAAQFIAKQVGISQIHANCTPQDKLSIIEQYQKRGEVVVFIGDGVNDAPSLAKADVGVALGSGSDLAMHSAAISIIGHSLDKVLIALQLAKKMQRNMQQNLYGSFVYNFCAVLIAAGVFYGISGVLLSPVIASVIMSVSSLSVIANALRI